ncbi:aldo-keto reductase family 1 member B1-like [Babylonia areolata]|uniref:aldo-keto reductase family 1 member B1-like n=1 Tax=Babylonia areolata TaxID=304850 RepID=UPI003FCF24B4
MAAMCPTVKLLSGYSMPVVGLGTFDNLKSDLVCEAVKAAIDSGYRLIDCAYIYRSEHAVGQAIADRVQAGVIRREDLFVTTKLWNTFHEPERVELGLRESLEQLGLEYVDLFLMHWPMAFTQTKTDPKAWILDNMEPADVDFVDTWKAMEQMVEKGLAKSIGVSNFNVQQLTRLLNAPIKIKPDNIQLESHPLFNNQELIDFCRAQGLSVTVYSPLAKGDTTYPGKTVANLLDDHRVLDIATRVKRTPAQVVLRWTLQRGLCLVPKSCTPSRIRENFQIFDFTLSEEDMATITAMNENCRLVTINKFKNFPEYPF